MEYKSGGGRAMTTIQILVCDIFVLVIFASITYFIGRHCYIIGYRRATVEYAMEHIRELIRG